MKQTRVIAYVDGFNLYFGLKTKGWKRYYWLNIFELCKTLLVSNQELTAVKYFTARITAPADKVKRQSIYLDALKTLEPKLQTIEGIYLTNIYECRQCGFRHLDSKEKMTDVNIAVEMISDALNDFYDTALLISADSDLVPALKLIKRINNKKRIVVGFPPERYSKAIEQIADYTFPIFRTNIAKSVFPSIVTKSDGYKLVKPVEWY